VAPGAKITYSGETLAERSVAETSGPMLKHRTVAWFGLALPLDATRNQTVWSLK
jgi:hypothetical protein